MVFIAQNITAALAAHRPVDWQWDVVHEVLYWGVWGLFTPFIVRQASRFWIDPRAGYRPWLAHVLLSLAVALVQIAVTYLLHGIGLVLVGSIARGAFPSWYADRGWSIAVLSFTGFLYYWVILGIHYSLTYRRMYLAQRAEVAEATLDALRRQLQPHFLFNALNSVVTLIDESPVRATVVLRRLSEMLRRVLGSDLPHEVPLREELDLLQDYLDIQRARFEERLRVTIAVEPAARGCLVPWLILQPLVENAVRFAVEPRVGGGRITITGRRSSGDLLLGVADDGPPPALGGPASVDDGREGVGLGNTRARLEHLHGRDFECTAIQGATGFEVRLRIPCREREG